MQQKHLNILHHHCSCAYFFAAGSTDGSSVADASPQLVSLPQEAGKTPPPVFPQRPGKNLILGLLLIFLHGVCQIPAEAAQEPHSAVK